MVNTELEYFSDGSRCPLLVGKHVKAKPLNTTWWFEPRKLVKWSLERLFWRTSSKTIYSPEKHDTWTVSLLKDGRGQENTADMLCHSLSGFCLSGFQRNDKGRGFMKETCAAHIITCCHRFGPGPDGSPASSPPSLSPFYMSLVILSSSQSQEPAPLQ